MVELHSARRSENMTKLERSRCAVLSLVLKDKWYDMISSGKKIEEYRLAKKYWRKRLHNWDRRFKPQTTPVVEFRRGYAKDAPRMAFWCLGCETVSGLMPYAYVDPTTSKQRHPEWGEPTEPHFVILLGGRVILGTTTREVSR